MVRNTHSGYAIFETAIFALFLLSLLSGGVALWDYMNLGAALRSAADAHFQQSETKAFSINSDQEFSSLIKINHAAIEFALKNIVKKVAHELQSKNYFLRKHPEKLYLQSCYGVLQIHTKSGKYLGIESLNCPAQEGNPAIVDSSISTDSFSKSIAARANSHSSNLAAPSIYALPGGINSKLFLPRTIIAGIRVYVSLKGSAASIASFFFANPSYIYHDQIVTLRGDVL